MSSILLLGFVMGMRHALDADHLAAVAALATKGSGMRASVVRGAAWGLGHTLTLLLVGGAFLLFGTALPAGAAHALEAAVGLMLVVLGADVFRRLRQRRIHLHVHRHAGGLWHLHAHGHEREELHDPQRHDHPHGPAIPRRALLVGLVHGLAGSAALLLAVLSSVASPMLGLAYIALFGIGSILGMVALSAAIAVPLRASAGASAGMHTRIQALIGLATVGIGLSVLYKAAW